MDLKLLRSLVRLMKRGDVNELEIDDEKTGLRVHLRRGESGSSSSAPIMMLPGSGTPVAAPGAPAAPAAAPGAAAPAEPAAPDRSGMKEIESPMVGTFYRASSPDSDPFMNVGSTFEEDDVVCIIEAMKVMNEIKAECSGRIAEILVENGDPVEFGQPLFLVEPA